MKKAPPAAFFPPPLLQRGEGNSSGEAKFCTRQRCFQFEHSVFPVSDTRRDVFVVEARFARRGNIRRVKAKAYMFVSTLVFVPATAVWGRWGEGGIGSVVTTVSS